MIVDDPKETIAWLIDDIGLLEASGFTDLKNDFKKLCKKKTCPLLLTTSILFFGGTLFSDETFDDMRFDSLSAAIKLLN